MPKASRAFAKILLLLVSLAWPHRGLALGQTQYVETTASADDFPLCAAGMPAAICADTNDFPGVMHAVNDLGADILRVTGKTPPAFGADFDPNIAGANLILIGTVGHSRIIDQLLREQKIDVSSLAGKWESCFVQVVPHPFPGVASALVICGSDQRGTIYGVYDLSEQMGVSPWHFFADVSVAHYDELFVKPGTFTQGPPAVKYRGIFINDEAPDLTGCAKEKFGGYNHGFYTNVFELLLRLRANYLWPAMWDNSFNEDDPLNYQLANEYGIVMGTSHVEPMMRADKEWGRAGYTQRDWNFETHSNELMAFWRDGLERNKDCENLITIAMRGKIDTPMSATANIALLEEIVAAQRQIIADVYHTNATVVPQLWALYKEVQEYYEKGMRVPDDVTLLWCDDNWGDLRRLPSPGDRQRAGGSGIYYHFDYVGSPRNYKWIDTIALPRVWEQMNLAHAYGANQIWIVNVGHLQHVQLPTEFFLSMAWNPDRWPQEKLPEFMQLWAAREFGADAAPQIADLMSRYGKLVSRRKPELLSPGTYSLVNYAEADTVLSDWENLGADGADVLKHLPAERRDAYCELVYYPIQAGANLNALYIAAAKNHLYAAQGRASANDCAAAVKKHFQIDAGLLWYYNQQLANGKWDHMMDQTHIGYTNWQQPKTNVIPEVTELGLPDAASLAVAIDGSTNSWPGCDVPAVLPVFDRFNEPSRCIDVFNRGRAPFEFSAAATASWIVLSSTSGKVEREQRLQVTIDWKHAPAGESIGFVKIQGATNSVSVKVDVFNPRRPGSFKGFVEADGYVSIEAEHFARNVHASAVHWDRIAGVGNTLSAMTIFPVTAASVTPPRHSPCLEYDLYLFHSGTVKVETVLSPTLNFIAGRGLRFGLSFDDAPPKIITAVPADYTVGDAGGDWQATVSDNARKVITAFDLKHPGKHTLKFWMVDPGVDLEKIVVDCGGVRPSYLGPPESGRGRE